MFVILLIIVIIAKNKHFPSSKIILINNWKTEHKISDRVKNKNYKQYILILFHILQSKYNLENLEQSHTRQALFVNEKFEVKFYF